MKKLITKTGTHVVDTRIPNTLYCGDEGLSEITTYAVIEMTDETFDFLNNIAIIENEGYGKKVWKVNNIEFREYAMDV